MLKILFAFCFGVWSLVAPGMAAENLREMSAAPVSHCAMMDRADESGKASADLPDCCRLPAPLLAEPVAIDPPLAFTLIAFDPPTDDRATRFIARPELPPPRA